MGTGEPPLLLVHCWCGDHALFARQVEHFGHAHRVVAVDLLARVFTEVRVTFAGASRVPDILVYRWHRVPLDATGRVADEFHEPADLVVEIVSPNQSVNALVRRCLWYVAHGVNVALLVDPGDESILLFRPNQVPRALRETDRIDIDDVLPGFDLSMADLFASLGLG